MGSTGSFQRPTMLSRLFILRPEHTAELHFKQDLSARPTAPPPPTKTERLQWTGNSIFVRIFSDTLTARGCSGSRLIPVVWLSVVSCIHIVHIQIIVSTGMPEEESTAVVGSKVVKASTTRTKPKRPEPPKAKRRRKETQDMSPGDNVTPPHRNVSRKGCCRRENPRAT